MQKGFTLIELIFAIVIIGVLAAVAVPQFAGMKDSAEVSNAANVANQLKNTGKASYMNLTELSGKDPADINITDIIDIEEAGDRWSEYGSGKSIAYASNSGDINISFTYNDNGTVTVNFESPTSGDDKFDDLQNKLEAQTGLDIDDSDGNASIDLGT